MVRRLNEGVLDSSDDLLKAIIDACAEVYGDEWDSMNGDEQHDIIMGFIKQAAKNIKSESVKKKNSNYRLNESARGYWGYLPNERLDDWIQNDEYEERWYNDKNIRGYKLFPIPGDFEDSGDPKYAEVFGVYSTNDNKLFYGTKEEAYNELVHYLNNSLYEYRHDL